jgi:hypothetical protein
MKFSSFKYSGSETKILPLGNTRARIGPKIRSPRLQLTVQATKSLPTLRAHPLATTVTKPWHLCTQKKITSKA